MVSSIYGNRTITQMRVRLYIPQLYSQKPIISEMISRYNLTVNITSASLHKSTTQGRFDVEIHGYIEQITSCLNYLESLDIKIVGKPNADGDSWHC